METLDLITAQHSRALYTRRQHEDVWQECYDYGLPYRGDFNTMRTEGADRMSGLFDTTMVSSLMNFANYLKSSIIPSGSQWVVPRTSRDLWNDRFIRNALHATGERLMEEYERSNFYPEGGVAIRDAVCIGNMCMRQNEGRLRFEPGGEAWGGLVFEGVSMGQVSWEFGPDGLPHAVFYDFEYTVDQAMRFFDNPGEKCRKLAAAKEYGSKCRFVHTVHRNYGAHGEPKIKKKFVSRYIALGEEPELLESGGFDYNPYNCARWMVVQGETYGRGPGHQARPNAKAASEIRRKQMQAADHDLDPTLMVPSRDYMDYDWGPGGTTVIDQSADIRPPQYLTTPARYDLANAMIEQDRQEIRQAFWHEAIHGRETEPRSAAESIRREQKEQQQAASPADTMRHEFLSPTVHASVQIMLRGGKLPELEAAIQRTGGKMQLDYQFVSPFFTSQKAESVQRTLQFVQTQLQLFAATQDPTYLDRIDPDKMSDYVAYQSDIPTDIFRTDQEVEELRIARAQAQAQQVQLNQQQQVAEIERTAPAQ